MKISDTLFLFVITIIVLTALGGYKLLTSHVSLKSYEKYFIKQNQTEDEQLSNSNEKIKAIFLGTSSILISDGETTLLTDGFISRPSISKLILSKIEPNTQKIDEVLSRLSIKKIDAIMTMHSHHDHALDSAYIANKTEAFLVGSNSTVNIARGYGIKEEKLKIITQKSTFAFGKFNVTLLPSSHSKLPRLIKKLTGIDQNIEKPLQMPSYFTNFKEGGTYSLYIEHPLGNIFINASTGFVENQLQNYQADVVFLGIAGLGKTPLEFQKKYFKEVVQSLEAKKVIPIHWDDFTQDINEPTIAMNKLFDDFNGSMQFLIQKSQKSGVKLQMLKIFDEIVLFDEARK